MGRDYHHSNRREILREYGGLTCLPAQILEFDPLFKGSKLGQPNFLSSPRHTPVSDLSNAWSINFLSHSVASRHLFNRKITSKASGRVRGRRIALALC